MDGHETLILILSIGAILVTFGRGVFAPVVAPHLTSRPAWQLTNVGPLVAILMLVAVLRLLASFDVRDSAMYLGFYLVLGIAWLGVAREIPSGISLRDDVLERDNAAAAVAWVGLCIGLMACYAGANIGDGPSFMCVIHAGGLATLGFFVTAALVNRLARLQEHVSIDRDLAAGIRLASFFVTTGVLWGRSAAGDFASYTQTILDMHTAWPVLVVVLKVVVVERFTRPTPEHPSREPILHGVLPATFDAALLLVGLYLAGPLPDGYQAP